MCDTVDYGDAYEAAYYKDPRCDWKLDRDGVAQLSCKLRSSPCCGGKLRCGRAHDAIHKPHYGCGETACTAGGNCQYLSRALRDDILRCDCGRGYGPGCTCQRRCGAPPSQLSRALRESRRCACRAEPCVCGMTTAAETRCNRCGNWINDCTCSRIAETGHCDKCGNWVDDCTCDRVVEIGSVRIGHCECGRRECDGRCRREIRARRPCCKCGEAGCYGSCLGRRFCKARFCAKRCGPRCTVHCDGHCGISCRDQIAPGNDAISECGEGGCGKDSCGDYKLTEVDICLRCRRSYDDCECDEAASRDDRALVGARARGAGIARGGAPTFSGGAYAWGGALNRVSEAPLAPAREDELSSIHGRRIPIGYAQYQSMTPDVGAYTYVNAGGWRIAVPNSLGDARSKALVSAILAQGPQAVGYIRMGDTLMPGSLEPVERAALSYAAPLRPWDRAPVS
jgi:hypothetical protein